MSTHIIYIPGLGDRYDGFRVAALKLWKLWGVNAVHVPITWHDGGSMESKLAYVGTAINAVKAGENIVLIGESAGATLALHTATHDRRVLRVITLCGVSRPDTPVSDSLRRKAPALGEAVDTLPETFEVDVHSVRAAVDGVVGPKYSSTTGAARHIVWSVGHITTISLCLTLLAPMVCAIAKKQKK